MVAKILIDVPVKAVDKLYDYDIPAELENVIEIGSRVIVPFGPRELMGFCIDLVEKADYDKELKMIINVLDIEPYLTPELIRLAKKIAIDTTTMLIKVLETMLPAALKAVYTAKLIVVNRDKMSDVLKSLFNHSEELIFDKNIIPYAKAIKQAIKENSLRQTYDIKSKSRPQFQRMIQLIDPNYLAKSKKHLRLIEYLMSQPGRKAKIATTLETLNLSTSVIKTLENKQVIKIFEHEIYREVEMLHEAIDKRVELNSDQETAYQEIIKAIDTPQTFLLHGVTGSGKTEIYLAAIEEVLRRGKEIIFLVPEIALTPMMVQRFKGRFKNQVAILHSGLSIGEKYDEWRKIIRSEAKIVVGARSACFAPFTNLGLIVIDECHESTYKQEDMPKYYAIDVCLHRAQHYGIPVILGSATPNVETYARYKRGYFKLLELPKRAQNVDMPLVNIVDMKTEFKSGNTSTLSNSLQLAIQSRLLKNEQTILLINRRGYSTFVICRNCGHVTQCPNCDISLAYHEIDHSLKCHYCGHKEDIHKTCPKCGSSELKFMGTGTQKIETEIQELFPQARIVRMDNDTTRTKNAHEKLLNEFEMNGDILIGTQMIAKGLDYPKVTLVGIIQADGNLFNADFRSPEKTFQLIVQVSGRAGRHALAGEVIVQVYNPDHYAIRYAINNDYLGFYNYEMKIRQLARYIPFYFLIQIILMGENVRDLFLRGREIVKLFKSKLSPEAIILGPALPEVARIKNKYSCQILIKYRQEPLLDDLLFEVVDTYETDKIYVSVDKSPM
jgi:primosomal protein N' (replication factor Y)